MRRFLPERPDDQQNLLIIKQLRTNKPILVYARRSDPTAKDAKKDRTQSREMQTEDMIAWAKRNGWPDHLIYPYFADLGLSGTLRPDQRPDMLRLFDDLDSGKFDGCTIACWQENRPFRDETHIYYNQLIDKMLQHNVVMAVLSPRLYIYDMRDPFDKERLREKFKEAADFIPKHVKGWLLPARERAAWEDDEWAGMGDPPPGFIVDYDPKSETYKHLIPYWPHLEKVKEHFELYMEVAGEVSLFYQHLRRSPIIFPEFDLGLDRRVASKCKMSKYPGGGYYIKTQTALISMLTHPIYGGYRAVKGVIRRDHQGNKVMSHEPVIEKELREFAYYRLAKTDLDGNPIEGNPQRKYFHHDDKKFGLLKFRIYSDQGEVDTHYDPASEGRQSPGVYRIRRPEDSLLRHELYIAVVPCDDVESVIVKRLLERVEELSKKQESIETYEASAVVVRSKRLAKIKQIEESINDIDKNQGGLTRNLGKVEKEIEEIEKEMEDAEIEKDDIRREEAATKKEIKERRKQLLEKEIETLEIERKKLIKAKKILEEEVEDDIGTLEEELIKLKNGWSGSSFRKRRSLINFAIQEVRINKVSTHWMEIQVLWLHEEWGHEYMYYRRHAGSIKQWSDGEITLVETHYATMPVTELMALLPDRTWHAIRFYAGQYLDLPKRRRQNKVLSFNPDNSYSDLEFEKSKSISGNVAYTNWEPLSLL